MTGKVIIAKDYKDHPSGLYRFKKVIVGREFRGEIREYKAKVAGKQLRIYWSARLPGEYFHKDESWCIDKAVVSKLSEGTCITHYGVLVTIDPQRKISDKDLIEDYWLISKEDFDKFRIEHDYSAVIGKSEGAKGKLGSLQWKVQMRHFAHVVAFVPDDLKLKTMMVSNSRSRTVAI